MNTQLSPKSGKRQTKEMRGKMAPETSRKNLWPHKDENCPGTLISPGAGDRRFQIYVLSLDSSAQATRST